MSSGIPAASELHFDSGRQSGSAEQEVRSVPVVEGYARWAQTYDLIPNPLLALEERILDSLLTDVSKKFVLDVACGTGRWLRKLKARGAAQVAGVDLSAEMLAQASRKIALKGIVARGDARVLPVQSGVADLTISSFAVGYIDDLESYSRELARVTRPNGLIVVSDFHPSNYSRRWRRTFRLGNEVLEIRNFSRPLAVLCSTFECNGLALESCLQPSFDEPERQFFDRCGRGHVFKNARRGPAIFICVFKRAESHSSSHL